MKKFSFFGLLVLSLFFKAQTTVPVQVPTSVQTAFKELFADATPASWKNVGDGLYETTFKWKDTLSSATFDGSGLLQSTKKSLSLQEVPDYFRTHALKLYPDCRIADFWKVTTPDGKRMYELEVTKGSLRKSLVFSEKNEYLGEDIYEEIARMRKR